jgi:hypothetical protein
LDAITKETVKMNKEIITIFSDGTNADFPLDDIRGGFCLANTSSCATGDGKCNVNKSCSPNRLEEPDPDKV